LFSHKSKTEKEKSTIVKNCKRNFKWHAMQRWQCLIYNGTLKNVVRSSMHYIYQCFFFNCLVVFLVGFSAKMTCAFLVNIKTTVYATLLIRLRFQGYCCKSGIVVFAWRSLKIMLKAPFMEKNGWKSRIRRGYKIILSIVQGKIVFLKLFYTRETSCILERNWVFATKL